MPSKNESNESGFGCLIFLVVLCIFLFHSCGNDSSNSKNNSSSVSSSYTQKLSDEDYNAAVALAKQGKWDDCAVKLVKSHEGDNRAKVLYNYANAQKNFGKNDFSMAKHYLKNIPDDYSGDFSAEIKQMKNIVTEKAAKQEADEKKAKEAKEQEKAKHIYIGDPEEKIRKVFGTPDSVNRHVSSYSTTKQYVYYRGDKMICIYTEDGVVTDFQD